MRDVNRIDNFLSKFGKAWKTLPDWRFGQLIVAFTEWHGSDIFYMEDEDFFEHFEEFIGEYTPNNETAASPTEEAINRMIAELEELKKLL